MPQNNKDINNIDDDSIIIINDDNEMGPKKHTKDTVESPDKNESLDTGVLENDVEVKSDDKEEISEEVNTEAEQEAPYDLNELAKFMVDNDIIDSFEVGDTALDESGLKNLLQETMDKRVAQEVAVKLSGESPEYKALYEHLHNGGAVEDFIQTYSNGYDNIDVGMLKNNKVLQRKVVSNYYRKTTQWAESDINAFVTKHEDLAELEKEAPRMLKVLKEVEAKNKVALAEQTRVANEKAIADKQAHIQALKDNIANMQDFGGIPVDASLRKKISSNVFNDTMYTKLNSNFEQYRIPLALLDEFGFFDNITTFVANFRALGRKAISNKKYNFNKATKQENTIPNHLKMAKLALNIK